MRLFFGIPVPEELRTFYENELKPELSRKIKGKYVEPENLHITMLFLGEVEEVTFSQELNAQLSRIGTFEVAAGGYGYFGRPPRVFYMDVLNGLKELSYVHDTICDVLKISDSKFSPHITLIRIKHSPKNIESVIASLPYVEFTWKARELILFESKLTSNGPIYSIYEEFPLEAL